MGEATDREGADAPVLVVIDEDLNIASMTPGADAVMSRLPGYPGDLPTVVRSVAASVLSSRTPTDARIRDDAGRWLTLHGAPMIVGGTQRASLIIEQTDPEVGKFFAHYEPRLRDNEMRTAQSNSIPERRGVGWCTHVGRSAPAGLRRALERTPPRILNAGEFEERCSWSVVPPAGLRRPLAASSPNPGRRGVARKVQLVGCAPGRIRTCASASGGRRSIP